MAESLRESLTSFVENVIESYGYNCTLNGVELSGKQVADPYGGLPLLFGHSKLIAEMMGKREQNWLDSLAIAEDPKGLLGIKVDFQKNSSSVARYVLYSFLYDALDIAHSQTPGEKNVELSTLYNHNYLEVSNAFNEQDWSAMEPETEGMRQ